MIEEEIEDDLVLAIDIAQTPLSPVDPSQSSLFVNTSRNVTHTPSSFISKPLSTVPSPLKKFSSISISTSTSSSISTSISNPNSTDGEAVSTTCDMGVDRHPYPPLSILTERDAEEEEEEEEGEKGHGLLGPFLTAKELSPLCIYLAVKATKVRAHVLCVNVCICVFPLIFHSLLKPFPCFFDLVYLFFFHTSLPFIAHQLHRSYLFQIHSSAPSNSLSFQLPFSSVHVPAYNFLPPFLSSLASLLGFLPWLLSFLSSLASFLHWLPWFPSLAFFFVFFPFLGFLPWLPLYLPPSVSFTVYCPSLPECPETEWGSSS